MTLWLLFWVLAAPGDGSCEVGGKGAQCVTCTPSERGTVVCRGVCYFKDPQAPRPDGGYRSAPLRGEDKAEGRAKEKVAAQAREKCG